VRNNRKLFLSDKCYHTFKGMAFSHMSRLDTRMREGKRVEIIEKHGYDTKDASHIFRCLWELEQILVEGDLDLKREKEVIKEIKRGDWTKEDVRARFESDMKRIELIVAHSAVPYEPNEVLIKQLLVNCLEEKFGSLRKFGFNIFK